MANSEISTAVILAGGMGTRLRPYTVSLPKPLMPVGEHPILEIVVMQLRDAGIRKIIIAVGYLEPLIRAYFGDGERFGVEISYSSETEPLGTAGPLGLLKGQLDAPFVFMNGDVFTDLNYADLMAFHASRGGRATVGLSSREVKVDFGVIEYDKESHFQKWKEKPTLSYSVSMGIYVLDPSVLDLLPAGFVNIPDVIQLLAARDELVSCYIHNGYWLDIGRPDDYETACRDVQEKGLGFWLPSTQ